MAELLALLMEERGLRKRGLARVLAGDGADDKDIERWRRNVYRYLAGASPEPETAELMEQKLGLPEGYFPRHQWIPSPEGQTLGERLVALERRQGELADAVGELSLAVEAVTVALERLRDVPDEERSNRNHLE